jgi:hypothetical protein
MSYPCNNCKLFLGGSNVDSVSDTESLITCVVMNIHKYTLAVFGYGAG